MHAVVHPIAPPASSADTADPAVPTPHDHAEDLLAQLAKTKGRGKRQALEQEIVLLTLDIADRAARRFHGRGIESEDLQQVARLALVKAVRGFRPGRGPCFAAYAVPTISGEIKRHFRDTGWAVRPPRRLQEARLRLVHSQEDLRRSLRREPTTRELQKALGLSAGEFEEALAAGSALRATSLDAGVRDEPIDVPDHDDAYAGVDQRDALHRALGQLGCRDMEILRLRFVEEHTQAEIGRAIGVSQMQVSRLLSATLERLRSTLLAADAVA